MLFVKVLIVVDYYFCKLILWEESKHKQSKASKNENEKSCTWGVLIGSRSKEAWWERILGPRPTTTHAQCPRTSVFPPWNSSKSISHQSWSSDLPAFNHSVTLYFVLLITFDLSWHSNHSSNTKMKRKATTTDTAAAAAASSASSPQTKKKRKPSPLLGKPQKFYAPESATSNMTREELSAWRKEERRKRNRASAAASRIKTQSKIADLEGQVSHWKSKCEEMQDRMMKLQRQVDMLTRAQSPTLMSQQQQQQHNLVSPPSSQPNSPSSTSSSLLEPHPSIVTSSSLDVKNFLAPPSLTLSPPSEDQTLSVESKADITSSQIDESKKHLNMISRQA